MAVDAGQLEERAPRAPRSERQESPRRRPNLPELGAPIAPKQDDPMTRPPPPDPRLLAALRDAHARELRAAGLYRMMAEAQCDAKRRSLLERLAHSERSHARRFAERIVELGGPLPAVEERVGPADRLRARMVGVEAMLRGMEAEEERARASSERNAGVLAGDAASRELFLSVEREERAHSRLLQAMHGPGGPATRLEAILKGERWHVTTGSWIGDAIYGVNDGLGAVFGIVSGMAGYSDSGRQVVFAGLLGTLASALSMGSSAFLASRSEREVYEAELGRERREIEEAPEHEREELALIYQLKGFTEAEAEHMAATISGQPEQFLRTMAQEELGLSERHLPNPWLALGTASVSTAIGALIPVLPFLFAGGARALVASAAISTLAHFAVGAAKSLVTARHWFVSGLEMTAVGVVMGVVTYVLGVMFRLG